MNFKFKYQDIFNLLEDIIKELPIWRNTNDTVAIATECVGIEAFSGSDEGGQ